MCDWEGGEAEVGEEGPVRVRKPCDLKKGVHRVIYILDFVFLK